MRNIFLFIRRYFNFLFFLVLQIIALSFLFRYNKFHEAAFLGAANEVTGSIGGQVSNIEYYFQLKRTNEELVVQNETLLNRMPDNFQSPDTLTQAIKDTVRIDTTTAVRRYLWRSARVVNNSTGLQYNYITIHRGSEQGVKKDMGVISSRGVVGMVVHTSDNYAVVMSLLNRQSSVSAKLLKTGEVARVFWDGQNAEQVTMINIAKNVPVAVGDSVITSGYSLSFPPGVLIGTIAEVINEPGSNFYTLRLKTATNFYNIEYVYAVENLQKEEQIRLEEAARKNQ